MERSTVVSSVTPLIRPPERPMTIADGLTPSPSLAILKAWAQTVMQGRQAGLVVEINPLGQVSVGLADNPDPAEAQFHKSHLDGGGADVQTGDGQGGRR